MATNLKEMNFNNTLTVCRRFSVFFFCFKFVLGNFLAKHQRQWLNLKYLMKLLEKAITTQANLIFANPFHSLNIHLNTHRKFGFFLQRFSYKIAVAFVSVIIIVSSAHKMVKKKRQRNTICISYVWIARIHCYYISSFFLLLFLSYHARSLIRATCACFVFFNFVFS